MWVDAKTYARQVGLPVETIRRFCRMGLIPNFQIGRKYQFRPKDANRVIKELKDSKQPSFTSMIEGAEMLRKRLGGRFA